MENLKVNFEKYKSFFKTENFESKTSELLNNKEVFSLLEEYHPKYFTSDVVARALDLDQILNGECNARLLDIERSFVDDLKKEYPHIKGSSLNSITIFRIKKELNELLIILLKEIFYPEEKNFEADCNSSKSNVKEKTLDSVERVLAENQKILGFIKEYQEKNAYDPRSLNEYNAKFIVEFNHFLETSNFLEKTIKLFKSEN